MSSFKVLVCGGAGYIGSHTVRQLRRSTTWDVVLVDNFSSGHWGAVPSDVIVEVGDVRCEDFLAHVFKKHKPDAVMHFCASIVVPDSVRDPLGYYDNNVVGTLRLINTMVKFGCKKFIFSSTAALFGHPDRIPIQPMDTTKPESPYGDTKLIIEWLLKSCNVAYGMRYVCLRYFNACGADPSGEIGERHEPETHLVPVIIDVALGKRKQISVFGTDFPTPDGTCVRDYIHVNDLASAHIKAVKYLIDEKNPPGYFNLGTGIGSSVKDVIVAVETVAKKKLTVVLADRREGDPAELVADPSLANKVLQWKAEFSLLDMVDTAHKFHEKMHLRDLVLAPHVAKHKELLEILHHADQMHLFDGWSAAGTNDDKKNVFFQKMEALHRAYPGGLQKYLQTAQQLLAKTRDGHNPWEGYNPSVPSVANVAWASATLDTMEDLAMTQHLPKCGIVLVAGGLGERLGFNGIKIQLPVECVTMQSHLEHYLAYLHSWNIPTMRDGKYPFCIMTSDDTHELTVSLLRTLGVLEKVFLVKQEKVPALSSNHAMLCKTSTYELDIKPHGSGDIHSLLHKSGIASSWHNSGVKHIAFIQDTNALAMRCVPFAVAHCVASNQDMVFVTIPRTPGSLIGCVVALEKKDGRGSKVVANVEYNVLDSFLREASSGASGDVASADGMSPFPGNTNTLVLRLASYVAVLQASGGRVPEYVAPKYADAGRHKFVSPTRVECTMEDISQLFPPDKVCAVSFPEWMCFNPVKNNIKDAAAKVSARLPPWSAFHSEAMIYAYNKNVFRHCAAVVADGSDVTINGPLVALMPPKIVLSPSWYPVRGAAARKIGSNVRIAEQSTLVLNGPNIKLENMTLNGVLIVKAAPGAHVTIKNVTCHTPPWLIVSAGSAGSTGSKETDLITGVRGFRIQKKGDATVLNYPSAGVFVYDGSVTPSKL